MISAEFGFFLTMLSLVHLWLQGYNRHYILVDDGPLKRPLNHGWFAASVFVPAVLLITFYGTNPVQDALRASPRGSVSWIIFSGLLFLYLLAAWRLVQWGMMRSRLRHSRRLRAEGVTHATIENEVHLLPMPFSAWETTTALEIIHREVFLPNLATEFHGLQVAHVSDLHFDPRNGLAPYLDEVCRIVNGLHPDVIVFTGDFVNSARHIRQSVALHARFRAPLGVFAVLGNHDYWTRPRRLVQALEQSPIVYLNNRRHAIQRGGRKLILAGTDFPWNREEPHWPTLLSRGAGEAVILLSHVADNAPVAARHGANLVLAGHNHGGQVCLPLVGPVVVPSRLGHRFTAGLYDVSPTCVVNVSRGVGVSTGGFRFLCPPEVTVLRLLSAEADVAIPVEEAKEARLINLAAAPSGS